MGDRTHLNRERRQGVVNIGWRHRRPTRMAHELLGFLCGTLGGARPKRSGQRDPRNAPARGAARRPAGRVYEGQTDLDHLMQTELDVAGETNRNALVETAQADALGGHLREGTRAGPQREGSCGCQLLTHPRCRWHPRSRAMRGAGRLPGRYRMGRCLALRPVARPSQTTTRSGPPWTTLRWRRGRCCRWQSRSSRPALRSWPAEPDGLKRTCCCWQRQEEERGQPSRRGYVDEGPTTMGGLG
jgi:hypothetical protein